jgi:hypothetical protein
MAIKIEAFTNSDDAFIAWRSSEQIADCIGFDCVVNGMAKMKLSATGFRFPAENRTPPALNLPRNRLSAVIPGPITR